MFALGKKVLTGKTLNILLIAIALFSIFANRAKPIMSPGPWSNYHQIFLKDKTLGPALYSRLDSLAIEHINKNSEISYFHFSHWKGIPLNETGAYFDQVDSGNSAFYRELGLLFEGSGNDGEYIYLSRNFHPFLLFWQLRDFPLEIPSLGPFLLGRILLTVIILVIMTLQKGLTLFHRIGVFLWGILLLHMENKYVPILLLILMIAQWASSFWPKKSSLFSIISLFITGLGALWFKNPWFFTLGSSILLLIQHQPMNTIRRDHNLFEPQLFNNQIKLPRRNSLLSGKYSLVLASSIWVLSVIGYIASNHGAGSHPQPTQNSNALNREMLKDYLYRQRILPLIPHHQLHEAPNDSLELQTWDDSSFAWGTKQFLTREGLWKEMLPFESYSIEGLLYAIPSNHGIEKNPYSTSVMVILLSSIFWLTWVIGLWHIKKTFNSKSPLVIKIRRRLKVA